MLGLKKKPSTVRWLLSIDLDDLIRRSKYYLFKSGASWAHTVYAIHTLYACAPQVCGCLLFHLLVYVSYVIYPKWMNRLLSHRKRACAYANDRIFQCRRREIKKNRLIWRPNQFNDLKYTWKSDQGLAFFVWPPFLWVHSFSLFVSARVCLSAFYVSLSLCLSLFHCVNKKKHIRLYRCSACVNCVCKQILEICSYIRVCILRQYAFQVYHRHWTFSFIFCFSSLLFTFSYVCYWLVIIAISRNLQHTSPEGGFSQ